MTRFLIGSQDSSRSVPRNVPVPFPLCARALPNPPKELNPSLPHSTSLEDPATETRTAVSERDLSTIGTEAQKLMRRLEVAREAGLVGDPETGGD